MCVCVCYHLCSVALIVFFFLSALVTFLVGFGFFGGSISG